MASSKTKLMLSLTALAICQFSYADESTINDVRSSNDVKLTNESYSVGYEYVRKLKLLIEKTEHDHPNLKFDKEMLIKGLSDSITSTKPLLDKEQRKQALTHLDTLTTEESDKTELDLNYQNGLLAQKQAKEKPGAMATASGLLYHVVSQVKEGKHPTDTSIVTLKYKASLVNGKVFDDSSTREYASRFVVKDLAAGLKEGVLLMREGDHFEFIIKPELAYGETNQPGIPPNSTLYYDVELEKIK